MVGTFVMKELKVDPKNFNLIPSTSFHFKSNTKMRVIPFSCWNASCPIIYFVTKMAVQFVKYLFLIDGDALS